MSQNKSTKITIRRPVHSDSEDDEETSRERKKAEVKKRLSDMLDGKTDLDSDRSMIVDTLFSSYVAEAIHSSKKEPVGEADQEESRSVEVLEKESKKKKDKKSSKSKKRKRSKEKSPTSNKYESEEYFHESSKASPPRKKYEQDDYFGEERKRSTPSRKYERDDYFEGERYRSLPSRRYESGDYFHGERKSSPPSKRYDHEDYFDEERKRSTPRKKYEHEYFEEQRKNYEDDRYFQEVAKTPEKKSSVQPYERRERDDKKSKREKDSSDKHKKKKHKHKHHKQEKEEKDIADDYAKPSTSKESSKHSSPPRSKRTMTVTSRTRGSSSSSDERVSEHLEKTYETRLLSLRENLLKRQKEMQDIVNAYTIPEKKIRLYADVVLEEKRKEEELEKAMKAQSLSPGEKDSSKSDQAQSLVSQAFWRPPVRPPKDEKEDGEFKTVPTQPSFMRKSDEKPGTSQEDNSENKESQANEDEKKSSLNSQIIIGKKGKTGLRFGLKISELSAQLISSGTTDQEALKLALEDGEISESEKSKHSDDEEEKPKEELKKEEPAESSDSDKNDEDTEGVLSESDGDNAEAAEGKTKKEHKKEKKKKKDKKQKKSRESQSEKDKSRRSKDEKHRDDQRRDRRVSGDRDRRRSHSRDRGRSYRSGSRDRKGSRRSYSRERRRDSRSRYSRDRYRHRSSRSRTPDDLRIKIDKAKLREIAFKNAYHTLQSGGPLKPEQVAAIKAGGKSVDELVDYCRRIQAKTRARNSDSSDDDLPPEPPDDDDAFINHPFKLKPMLQSVVMNIRNAKQLPVSTFAERTTQSAELRLQFPVSSGSQHKSKEGEWVPVSDTDKKPAAAATASASAAKPATAAKDSIPLTLDPAAAVAAAAATGASIKGTPAVPAPATTDAAASVATTTKPAESIFPNVSNAPQDVGSIVSERLTALRRLQSNPNDVQAMNQIYKAQNKMNSWVQSKQLPGQFTGSTGLNLLSAKQLAQGGIQPWAKKDLFHTANPVAGGIGRALLQKMGWKEGTGLGKDETGKVEPLQLDVKVDRKGLHGSDEKQFAPLPTRGKHPPIRDMSGKHPVTVVTELCKRRNWRPPTFDQVSESGPAHKKVFIFRVNVNGVAYQPAIGSGTKKMAKASAAQACLQEMGLVPRDPPPPGT